MVSQFNRIIIRGMIEELRARQASHGHRDFPELNMLLKLAFQSRHKT